MSDARATGADHGESLPFAEPVQRVVRPVFGTVASIGIVGPVAAEAIEACFARLEEIEARFSPYRSDSEISRIRDVIAKKAMDINPRNPPRPCFPPPPNCFIIRCI